MKNITKYFLMTALALLALSGKSFAEENSAEMQDVRAACAAEAEGADNVQEYIDECIKDKEEELKELAQQSEKSE